MLFILFIGCKILAPVFGQVKLSVKETSITTDESDAGDEKKAEPNALEKEKEFASFYSYQPIYVIWNVTIIHSTAYSNNYQSAYYNTITIPPPDRC